MLLVACSQGPTPRDLAPAHTPFRIPVTQFAAGVRTVALAPVATPAFVVEKEAVGRRFESLIAQNLSDLGYDTVRSSTTSEVWRAVNDQLLAGRPAGESDLSPQEGRAAREHTLYQLARRERVDALLSASIVVVDVHVNGFSAEWGGIKQKLPASAGGVARAAAALVDKGWSVGGGENPVVPGESFAQWDIKAMTLVVTIEDRFGAELYVDGGGIEVMNRIGLTLEPIPPAELFQDPERWQIAVKTALARLPQAAPQ